MNNQQVLVQKPLSVARMDFINNLSMLINNAMLPSCIIETALRDAYNEIHIISMQNYESDKARYNELLRQAEMTQNQTQESQEE